MTADIFLRNRLMYRDDNGDYDCDDDDDDDDDHVLAAAGCDWLIVVDDCVGDCQLVSPEYPDFYPADVRCSYLITSFHHSRVELVILIFFLFILFFMLTFFLLVFFLFRFSSSVELVMSSSHDAQTDAVFLDIKSR